jgi:L-amino acid N-acyltransferase
MEGVALLPALREHNEAIREIYNKEVRGGLGTLDIEPRTAMEQGQWLAEHDDRWPAFVAVMDGAVVGFGALSRYCLHPGYRHTVEDSIYIEESVRGQGIATLVLHRLLGAVIERKYHSVMARIVAGEQAALTLHESFGFQQVACEREVGRKFERWLDVSVLQLVLPTNAPMPTIPAP